jgi:hypothetical protein
MQPFKYGKTAKNMPKKRGHTNHPDLHKKEVILWFGNRLKGSGKSSASPGGQDKFNMKGLYSRSEKVSFKGIKDIDRFLGII